MTQQQLENIDISSVITWLEDQDYKVIRPFTPPMFYSTSSSPTPLMKAAILDVETTGMNILTDKIIELGIVIVEYCPSTGQVYRVLETYSELEDPGIPIPAESTKIHGITDEMVHGKSFINTDIENLFKDVHLVIAHNAAFDRGFVEKRFPFFQEKPWGCSFSQVPWKEEGIGSAALDYLLYKCGFHFKGHRAVADCHALLEVLQLKLPVSGIKALKMIINAAQTPALKIWALLTPFESKDNLKNRGYRWNVEHKTWCKILATDDLSQEIDWLRQHIYNNRPFQLKQESIDAYHRFSARYGYAEVVNH